MQALLRKLSVFSVILALLCGAMVSTASAQGITCDPATPTAASPAAPAASPVTPTEVAFPADGGELTVFAAASLTDAFAKIGEDIQAANPNVTITFQTGSSQALVTQLEEGATADVLATASLSTMKQAEEGGLIVTPSSKFVSNKLVIVTPADNPADITSLEDLTKDGTKLVIAAPEVPAGNYARIAVCAWGADNPDGVSAISNNIVSEEADVRGVLSKVQTGEADAGIVYLSDAKASELAGTPLNVIDFPEGVPVSAAYAIAPVEGGNADLANAFISYVLSPAGQQVLTDFGFTANQ